MNLFRIDSQLASQPITAPSPKIRKGIPFTGQFAYIYTSGTTGLPKVISLNYDFKKINKR